MPENLRLKYKVVDLQNLNISEEETKQTTYYLPLLTNLQRPIVDPITIEKFSEQNLKVYI